MYSQDQFPIFSVDVDSVSGDEHLGTKEKFWFNHKDLGKCLFKRNRENTGEDWSEKIACEFAALLGIPHARYEFGEFDNSVGIISPIFLDLKESLIHGNELLGIESSSSYQENGKPVEKKYYAPIHTVENVCARLQEFNSKVKYCQNDINDELKSTIRSPADLFTGYLLLDAWIGNGDRHHQNWGIVALIEQELKFRLAPSYDHASCLGRELNDQQRKQRLSNTDHRCTVATYVAKNKSAFFANSDSTKTVHTLEAFSMARQLYSHAAQQWIDRLIDISDKRVQNILDRVPSCRMSTAAREFAFRMLQINKNNLENHKIQK